MILVLLIVLIGHFLPHRTSAVLMTCPTPDTAVKSIRYDMTLSSPGRMSSSGTLFLSSSGHFIALISLPDAGSPQSAIQGTWSSSSCGTSMTLIAQTLYFLEFPNMSVNNLTCNYACGTNSDARRQCTAVYTLRKLQAVGSYSFLLDLSVPE